MDEIERKLESGQIKEVKQEVKEVSAKKESFSRDDSFIDVLTELKRFKREVSSAPTWIPKTLLGQIEFYESAGVYRVYFYVKNGWHYILLT